MNTPVADFIVNYINSDFVRLHVPGHKGNENPFDITEFQGADVLYHEDGILAESQRNASLIFGTAKTVYSAEGSSLGIRGMLTLIKMYAQEKGRRPVVAAARNAHKVFMTASALLDIDVDWIYPVGAEGVVAAEITPDGLRDFLLSFEEMPVAVYITSPDYIGNRADIRGLSEVCREYGVLLAVDNAHGAYLHFLEDDLHPISLGADMCCDSAHKTLPVLTGGAYLHISKNAPASLCDYGRKAMSLFASTSPSYLILASLDKVNKSLSEGYSEKIRKTAEITEKLKAVLKGNGYILAGNEPLKISIKAKEYGYYGTDFADILRSKKIEVEFSDPDFAVMMITPENSEEELCYLEKILLSVPKKERILSEIPEIIPCEQAMSVGEALFKPSERINVNEAVGRILASPSVGCPPAIPIAICGERLTENAVKCFNYYGTQEIDVIKE